jgi:hypothetical protein
MSTPSADGATLLISGIPGTGTAGNYLVPVQFTDERGVSTQRNVAMTIAEPTDLSSIPSTLVLFQGISQKVSLPLTHGFPIQGGFSRGDGLPIFNGVVAEVLLGCGPACTDADTLGSNDIFQAQGPQGNLNFTTFTPPTLKTYHVEVAASTQVLVAPLKLGTIGPVVNKNLTIIVTIPGDANGDGVVDCNDYSLVKNSLNSSRGTARYNDLADVNHDGAVNVQDLAFVQSHLAGMICR